MPHQQDPAQCPLCRVLDDASLGPRVAQLSASTVILGDDQTFRGRAILVLNRHAENLWDLEKAEYAALMEDVRVVTAAAAKAFSPELVNVASLGNIVRHLHVHVIPRYEGDPNHGGAPWPVEAPIERSPAELDEIAAELRAALSS